MTGNEIAIIIGGLLTIGGAAVNQVLGFLVQSRRDRDAHKAELDRLQLEKQFSIDAETRGDARKLRDERREKLWPRLQEASNTLTELRRRADINVNEPGWIEIPREDLLETLDLQVSDMALDAGQDLDLLKTEIVKVENAYSAYAELARRNLRDSPELIEPAEQFATAVREMSDAYKVFVESLHRPI